VGYTDTVRRSLPFVLVTVFAVACGSTATEEEQDVRRWAREIRILEPGQVGDRPYDVLAELDERVRIGAMGESDAISRAKDNMRLRAAKVDADAVVLAGCRRLAPREDFEAGTTPTMRCVGYAIRWLTF